ncbi:MAG: bifunctional aspartate kinase/homoserine dehydrogenase I [Balneolaceae bacterium]
MQVLKFGGSSVGTPESIQQVYEIVLNALEKGRAVVVVSAIKGVTDQLNRICDTWNHPGFDAAAELETLEKRHLTLVRNLLPAQAQSDVITALKLLLNELEDVIHGVLLIRELTPRTRDVLLSFGERMSVTILTAFFRSKGIDTVAADMRQCIVTDAGFGNARVQFAETNRRLQEWFSQDAELFVATGFIGATMQQETTTIGRGGSDYTAAIVGAALGAERIEIWTDVNGLMTAHPDKVKRAFTIYECSYEEAMELSHFGAKVIYPPTMRPAMQAGIPIVIKNTFDAAHPGTAIKKTVERKNGLIRGLSSIEDVALITVKGSGMIGVSGIASRIFSALAGAGTNILLITQASSEHSVTLAVLPAMAPVAVKALEAEFHRELTEGEIDPVESESELSIIAIVGDNMKSIPGIAGRVFQSMGRNGINIRAIAQGSSERNISFVVARRNERKAMNALHDAFFLAGVKTVNLYLVGVGLIGGTLMEMITRRLTTFYEEYQIEFTLRGVANSRQMLITESQIPLQRWREELEANGVATSLGTFVDEMKSHNLPNSIFIDCTASGEVAELYPNVLRSSISIVTPNKKANSVSQEYYETLRNLSLRHNVGYKYETNAGAGLPVIATIHELVSTGDRVQRIEGVLSGTLSYIFNSYDGHTPFSEVVKQAREKGYTEPDPRDDLNGLDVARKLLILAREAGYSLEMDDLDIQNLVPEPARNADSVDQFFEELKAHDDGFFTRWKKANDGGKKLCYIATFQDGRGTVALEAIDASHPFYGLRGSDNIIALYTNYYDETPMVIKGPGAGARVTAGGIVADLLRVVSTKAIANAS